MPDTPPDAVVDLLFRRQSGRITAYLTRVFGSGRLDLVEDVVQEALLKALQHWPYTGAPRNPSGWLLAAARNAALDRLRRDTAFAARQDAVRAALERPIPPADADAALSTELSDDDLALICLCCHPALSREARVALTLKEACGFSVHEIARAFLMSPSAIAQRLVRAKRELRALDASFETPSGPALLGRLPSALEALYLMFNEGYVAHEGDQLIREDLCREALRLTRALAEGPAAASPAAHALLALLQLQSARAAARVDEAGDLLSLEEQDRSRWDRALIAAGLESLARSADGPEETPYHLQAAIAACHATATADATTDWRQILALYDRLIAAAPTPIAALNRAVAAAKVYGPRAGLDALAAIADHPALKEYHLLPAVEGFLHAQLGDRAAAGEAYGRALARRSSAPERRLIERRLARLGERTDVRP
jgi:RNA polymerase sigma-70 factor (ECF subfamily)